MTQVLTSPKEPSSVGNPSSALSTKPPPPQGMRRVVAAIARRGRRLWNWIDATLIRWASRSGLGSSLYYAFFNRSFDREHRAVLLGRLQWESSKTGPSSTSSLLRRNIHRLEKGLLMRPRRPVFALDYIGETVGFFESVVASDADVVSEGEKQWALDVLTEYFAVTGSHPKLDPFRARFNRLTAPIQVHGDTERFIPYTRDLATAPTVDFDDLLALSWRRRSVRWFEDRPVPRALIEKAVMVAGLSPSACNRQPFYFHVFDDPALLDRVARLPGGTVGFHHQFPAIIAVVGELRNYYGERDRHLIYVDASLAAMSFVLAAETLGLGTCCINWPDIEVDEARAVETLGLDPDQRPIMFLAVGYPDPDGMVAYSQKKPIPQLCRYNFE